MGRGECWVQECIKEDEGLSKTESVSGVHFYQSAKQILLGRLKWSSWSAKQLVSTQVWFLFFVHRLVDLSSSFPPIDNIPFLEAVCRRIFQLLAVISGSSSTLPVVVVFVIVTDLCPRPLGYLLCFLTLRLFFLSPDSFRLLFLYHLFFFFLYFGREMFRSTIMGKDAYSLIIFYINHSRGTNHPVPVVVFVYMCLNLWLCFIMWLYVVLCLG